MKRRYLVLTGLVAGYSLCNWSHSLLQGQTAIPSPLTPLPSTPARLTPQSSPIVQLPAADAPPTATESPASISPAAPLPVPGTQLPESLPAFAGYQEMEKQQTIEDIMTLMKRNGSVVQAVLNSDQDETDMIQLIQNVVDANPEALAEPSGTPLEPSAVSHDQPSPDDLPIPRGKKIIGLKLTFPHHREIPFAAGQKVDIHCGTAINDPTCPAAHIEGVTIFSIDDNDKADSVFRITLIVDPQQAETLSRFQERNPDAIRILPHGAVPVIPAPPGTFYPANAFVPPPVSPHASTPYPLPNFHSPYPAGSPIPPINVNPLVSGTPSNQPQVNKAMRQAARQLDQVAADLEDIERFQEADHIRQQAAALRQACRQTSTSQNGQPLNYPVGTVNR